MKAHLLCRVPVHARAHCRAAGPTRVSIQLNDDPSGEADVANGLQDCREIDSALADFAKEVARLPHQNPILAGLCQHVLADVLEMEKEQAVMVSSNHSGGIAASKRQVSHVCNELHIL